MDATSVSAGDRKRILLVDDIELNRILTAAVLAGEAYDVDCVGGGAEAVRAVETKAYDLVLMDLDMPGLDGYQAAAAISTNDEHSPRIVALTSRHSVSELDRARRVGMGSHLARPIAPREFLRAVKDLLAEADATTAQVFREDIQNEIVARLGSTRTHGFLATLLTHCEAALREATRDGADLDRMAHDLASTAGMLGFEDLSHRCRDVLVARDSTERARGLGPLSRSLVRTIALLRRQLETIGAAA